MSDRSEQEDFGEADLGEAQASETPVDPEMVDEEGGEPDPEELTDVPALEPAPSDATAIEETEAAGAQAGAIGGEGGAPEADPEDRAVAEGGGGEAEGFELAEDDLIESTSHGDPAGDPLGDRPPAEEPRTEGHTIHGEADDTQATDDRDEGEPG